MVSKGLGGYGSRHPPSSMKAGRLEALESPGTNGRTTRWIWCDRSRKGAMLRYAGIGWFDSGQKLCIYIYICVFLRNGVTASPIILRNYTHSPSKEPQYDGGFRWTKPWRIILTFLPTACWFILGVISLRFCTKENERSHTIIKQLACGSALPTVKSEPTHAQQKTQ